VLAVISIRYCQNSSLPTREITHWERVVWAMRGEGAGSRRAGSLGAFLGWVICLTLLRASGTEHYHPPSGRCRARSQSPSSVAYRLRKLATPIAFWLQGDYRDFKQTGSDFLAILVVA
jgi:hypothetical protein